MNKYLFSSAIGCARPRNARAASGAAASARRRRRRRYRDQIADNLHRLRRRQRAAPGAGRRAPAAPRRSPAAPDRGQAIQALVNAFRRRPARCGAAARIRPSRRCSRAADREISAAPGADPAQPRNIVASRSSSACSPIDQRRHAAARRQPRPRSPRRWSRQPDARRHRRRARDHQPDTAPFSVNAPAPAQPRRAGGPPAPPPPPTPTPAAPAGPLMTEERRSAAIGPLDVRRVMAALPHRYPMLLVDRVEELVLDERIAAIKAVTINEALLPGPFPRPADHARRADRRGAGAGRRRARGRIARPRRLGQARLFHGDRRRQVPRSRSSRACCSGSRSSSSRSARPSASSPARPMSATSSPPRPTSRR